MVSFRRVAGVSVAVVGLSGCYARTSCGELYSPWGGVMPVGLTSDQAEQLMCDEPLGGPQAFGLAFDEAPLVAGETVRVRPVVLGPGASELSWTFEVCDAGVEWGGEWTYGCGTGSKNWRTVESSADGVGTIHLAPHGLARLQACGEPDTWDLDNAIAKSTGSMSFDCVQAMGVRAIGRNGEGDIVTHWSSQVMQFAERWTEGPEALADLGWTVDVEEVSDEELLVTFLGDAPWDHGRPSVHDEPFVGVVGSFRAFPVGASLTTSSRSGFVAGLDGQVGLTVPLQRVHGDRVVLGIQFNLDRGAGWLGTDTTGFVLDLQRGEQGWTGELVEQRP